jgi:hypothetical protein
MTVAIIDKESNSNRTIVAAHQRKGFAMEVLIAIKTSIRGIVFVITFLGEV